MKKIKVVIAEDHPISAQSYKLLLEEDGLSVVGVVGDGLELIKWLECNEADVIVLDIQMPKMDGVEVAKYFVKEGLDYKILVVSAHHTPSFIKACKTELKIRGFITKAYCHLELTEGVIELFEGGTYFSQMPVLENMETVYIKRRMVNYELNDTERELLSMLTLYTYKEIATKKDKTHDSIKKSFQRIRDKLGVNSNVELGKILAEIEKR
ncbi:response regulator [Tenacibaculum sp. nBUS_03]|uniref:response regulator n=1 Tax=Tenacibaculum sp. nBUS_03 TaxID=3395320 RepID=UPI003EBE17DB